MAQTNMARTNDVSIEEKWRKIAEDARSEPNAMQPCEKRDMLLKKARQLDVAANLNSVLSSPGRKASENTAN